MFPEALLPPCGARGQYTQHTRPLHDIIRPNTRVTSPLIFLVEALRDAARHYRRAAGRPFILVVDSVDRLCAQEEGKIFDAFIAYAHRKERKKKRQKKQPTNP